ncbi:sodium:galactoside symporter [Marivivens niveibacter]|uniref:Sodium:galactoside symporter n=1 Tax=Marivivens niveibacter TaxID=1930667 RepID=A0A251X1H3_9RHOB|nr:MFS transporter [Marivivens niveibacter]OUD10547.1 sodium:galactoside symporter [Marivivens niveibacter]
MTQPSFWRVGVFALALAAAGIPIYIHLPRYAAADLGVPLTTLGALLMAIRLFDLVQDPLLGRMIDRYPQWRVAFGWAAMILLGGGFAMVFSVPAPIPVTAWLLLSLMVVFTGYSLGTILMYGQSRAIGDKRQLRLSIFRETGLLVGVIVAAAAPSVLGDYRAFGWGIAAIAIIAAICAAPLWRQPAPPDTPITLQALRHSGAVWLIALALVNSLPVAISSTLFLFYVEDRLALPELAGPYLILFFIASGIAIPIWSRLAAQFGAKRILLTAQCLSIPAFVGAFYLNTGDATGFAIICTASGFVIGADLVLLPTLFTALLARNNIAGGAAFGLWSFATKASLACAALIVLPALGWAGFVAGQANDETALTTLAAAYALLPCVLKMGAIALVLLMPRDLLRL